MISRVDRVSHPFDHPGPYTEERGSCPCLTHVAQRRLVRRTKFTALSSLRVMNLSTCRPQAQARKRRKQVCNILKHFYQFNEFEYLNIMNMNYWIWYYLKPFFIHLFTFACEECTTWLLCIWRTLFCFIFGFRIPAFRVALEWIMFTVEPDIVVKVVLNRARRQVTSD